MKYLCEIFSDPILIQFQRPLSPPITMYSEAQSNLWANEPLEALSNDVAISQPTKKICAKLKHQQNPWQDELKVRWRKIRYPLYKQSDIVKLNSTWHKHIQAVNMQRQNQRDFYMAQGNHQAAAQIHNEPDTSMSERACIVKQDAKTVGWDPTTKLHIHHSGCSLLRST